MDGARFDRLAASWARRHSRRSVLSLLSALAIDGLGSGRRAVAAKKADAAGAGCQGRCAQGQRCKHGACLDRCNKPGTCTDGGSGGGPPSCGPAGSECGCVKLGSGGGYCLAPSESSPGEDGCTSPGCQHTRDCPTGQVCARVPGCCPDKPRICAIPCPQEICTGDCTPATCTERVIAGPPTQDELTIQDTDSGLASIVVTQSDNADTPVPPFTVGTTDPVVVTSTKIDQSRPAHVTLVVTDVAGNVTTCDHTF
jgi:hypothetical protein